MKNKLLKKIKFQLWKEKIEKNYENEISIVLDETLKGTFLRDPNYFLNFVKEQTNSKKISFEIVRDLADREILFINF
ncbi:hypothetical protein Cp4447_02149 [Clostridium perfringens]|uniref:hypothetical protein n=1 Tax=Clostridium perfringens TaxID=1502 RepID=UPI002443FBBC|nr:hypothetical protein [Clostridium perfringens]MDG6880451.1 hypothetical protein [Clostridium perfringens]